MITLTSSHGKWDDRDIAITVTMIIKQRRFKCIDYTIKGISCMMTPPTTQSSWNMTPLNTKLKAFTMSNWRITYLKWRSKVHLMPWITISHPPLVITPNWWGEKCVTKVSQNWRHKVRLLSRYNVSSMVMEQTPLEGLIMAKRRVAPRICVI
jgi:hypothetical protein